MTKVCYIRDNQQSNQGHLNSKRKTKRMAKSKVKSTKTAKSTDIYLVVWSSEMDGDRMERLTNTEGYPEISSTTFSTEKEALEFIREEVAEGNYSHGFYSVAKVTRTVNTSFSLIEVA